MGQTKNSALLLLWPGVSIRPNTKSFSSFKLSDERKMLAAHQNKSHMNHFIVAVMWMVMTLWFCLKMSWVILKMMRNNLFCGWVWRNFIKMQKQIKASVSDDIHANRAASHLTTCAVVKCPRWLTDGRWLKNAVQCQGNKEKIKGLFSGMEIQLQTESESHTRSQPENNQRKAN